MGDKWKPNAPLTTPIFKKCMEILKETVALGPTEPSYENAVYTGCMLIVGFFGALRGSEINQVDIGELRARWSGSVNGPHPHIPITIVGGIKNDGGFKCYVQPMALVTNHGTDLGFWFRKLLVVAGESATGPMFKMKGSNRKATITEMDTKFWNGYRKGIRPSFRKKKTLLEATACTCLLSGDPLRKPRTRTSVGW